MLLEVWQGKELSAATFTHMDIGWRRADIFYVVVCIVIRERKQRYHLVRNYAYQLHITA